MKKQVALFGLLAALALGFGATGSHATTIANGLTPGVNNLLIDESREAYVDVNRNGLFDAGDVIFGYVKIDTFNPKGVSANNAVYGVFSLEVVSQGTGTLGGPVQTLKASTTAGLTLSDLTHTVLPANSVFALYDVAAVGGYLHNLVLNAPPGAVSMFDYINYLVGFPVNGEGAKLELVASITNPPDVNNFVRAVVNDPAATLGSPNAGLVNLPSSLTLASTFADSFFSVNNTPFDYAPLVPVRDPLTGIIGLNQFGVSAGPISGSAGANPQPQTWLNAPGFAQCLVGAVNTPCGFIDKNNFNVIPIARVPNPGSLLLLGAGLLMIGARVIRRKK